MVVLWIPVGGGGLDFCVSKNQRCKNLYINKRNCKKEEEGERRGGLYV